MKTISTTECQRPDAVSVSPGDHPELMWLPVVDLVLEPGYQHRLEGAGKAIVDRIARRFSWPCFLPVVVTPREDGKFTVIDGHRRTAAATAAGFDKVPCQIVRASREQRIQAFNAINGKTYVTSRMSSQAAGLATKEACAVKLAEICARAEVQLLRYPVPVDRQIPGQTMAVGAVAQCLERYGEETLITALQCVTQTANNRRGMLSARLIKALCAVLSGDPKRRDSGLALLEVFDGIDLDALQQQAFGDAAAKGIPPVQALIDRIRAELVRSREAPKGPPRNTPRPLSQ